MWQSSNKPVPCSLLEFTTSQPVILIHSQTTCLDMSGLEESPANPTAHKFQTRENRCRIGVRLVGEERNTVDLTNSQHRVRRETGEIPRLHLVTSSSTY